MPDQAIHIFNSTANLDPSLMVHLLESWAKEEPDPLSILNDLRVTIVMHNKMPDPPEHEFLVVKTEDRHKVTRLYVLERTTNPALGTVPGESRGTTLDSVKQFCAAITTNTSDLQFASVEEGLQKIDRLTLASVHAATILSDSLDKKGSYRAVDRFLGSAWVYAKGWHGQNIRFLIPSRPLSLYQLALIAKAVHVRFSTYDILKEQCYFHAGVIYSAVLHHFGSLCPENLQEPSEVAVASNLRYGRYLGLKVQSVDHKDIVQIVDDFKAAEAKALKDVSL